MWRTRRRIEPVRRVMRFKRKDGWLIRDVHIRDYVESNWAWKKMRGAMRKYE